MRHLASLALFGAMFAGAPAVGAAPEGPKLAFPLACEIGKTCEVQNYVDRDPSPGVLDYRCGHRTYDKHDGVDIRVLSMAAQRAGVAVLAAAPGRVLRVRDGVPDISIRAPGAPPLNGQDCGNGVVVEVAPGWITGYCHLARGSVQVKPGDAVAVGQPLAKVGLSGNTEFPHLHFMVRHNNAVVDPFAPDPAQATACTPQASLWTARAAEALAYRRGVVLNTGFAVGVAAPEAVEEATVAAPSLASPALVAYVRTIGLEAGDELELTVKGPDGGVVATSRSAPLDHDKAYYLSQVGRKRPPAGWSPGVYAAEYRVYRHGAVAITKRFQIRI
ncbi:MAG: peptidase [Phenylobacterium sp.]|nr:peptidase [Phenylobacterium sp.]